MNIKQCVFNDLNTKLEAGLTLDKVKFWSEHCIESYCLMFRLTYSHKLPQFKDATVNRYVEQWLKKKAK